MVLGQKWHSFKTGSRFHWQRAEPSTSPTCDWNRLLSLAEGECWSLLSTTAELTYLIVVVKVVNLPELWRLLKNGSFQTTVCSGNSAHWHHRFPCSRPARFWGWFRTRIWAPAQDFFWVEEHSPMSFWTFWSIKASKPFEDFSGFIKISLFLSWQLSESLEMVMSMCLWKMKYCEMKYCCCTYYTWNYPHT